MGPFPHSFNSSRLFSNKVSYPDTVNMSALAMETFWLNKSACDDAERAYYEKLSGCKVDTLATGLSSSEEMALVKKLNALETENKQLKKVTDDLKALVLSLEARVGTLEGGKPAAKATPAAAPAAEDDDDVDLFGSDDEEKKRILANLWWTTGILREFSWGGGPSLCGVGLGFGAIVYCIVLVLALSLTAGHRGDCNAVLVSCTLPC